MTPIAPPPSPLRPEWSALIRSCAAGAEKDGRLAAEVLDLIDREKWFLLHVPFEYGGPERALPETVRLLEALAEADGSTGWTVTLCSGAGWFGGFLEPDLSRSVFSGRGICLAGTGAASGTAMATQDGYRVSGRWQHASGALHASHFTANCRMLAANGQPLTETDGRPLIRPFLFLKDEVAVIPSWHCYGMVATGSHSFAVTDLEVPARRCFRIDPEAAVIDRTLYRYPFLQLAEATLAVNLSGMALHFIALCRDAFAIKSSQAGFTGLHTLQQALGLAGAELARVRSYFYTALHHSWAAYEAETGAASTLPAVSGASRQLAFTARRITEDLYPYCGLAAADPETDLNRVWRDLHTASQHPLLVY